MDISSPLLPMRGSFGSKKMTKRSASSSVTIWSNAGRIEDGDYHKTMNGSLFLEWLEEILPKLVAAGGGRKPVLVLDNAPYHNEMVEKIPTVRDSRQEISIPCDSTAPRPVVNDFIAATHGVTLLRLPPYQCTLNPIEHVWAYLKGEVCRCATGKEKLDEVRAKAVEVLERMPLDMQAPFFADVEKVEKDFIRKEELQFVATPIAAKFDDEGMQN